MNFWKSLTNKLLISFIQILGLFLAGRIYFFFDYLPSDFWSQTTLTEVINVFFSATRFDFSITSTIIIIPVLVSILAFPFSKLVGYHLIIFWNFYLRICLCITLFFIVVSHYYFYYYQVHFNSFFWEFWDNWENSKLVLWSIFDELPIVDVTLSILGLFIWVSLLTKIFSNITKFRLSLFSKKISLAIVPILLLVGMRGTFDPLPLTMQRYRSQISSVSHLNLIHGNPYYELYSSWEDNIFASDSSNKIFFLKQSTPEIPNWFKKISELDNRRKFIGKNKETYHLEYKVPALREKYLRQKPKHIVIIFMESQVGWLSQFKEKDFQTKIRNNFVKIKKNSLSFKNYFQESGGTFNNLVKINLPIPTNSEYRIGYSSAIYKPFPNTLPKTMMNQGYKPLFFYGGSLAWHRVEHIMKRFGYEEIYGENSIKNALKTRFGVHDGDLYELVHERLSKAKEPTFNFVLTLSNHPPYSVPQNFIGPITSSNAPTKLKNKIIDKNNFNKRMRAVAYADHALGEFFTNAMQSPYFNETLFVLTSDHAHDMALKWEPEEYYLQKKIPLLFHSPLLLNTIYSDNENFGSHLDMIPTILSMISDKTIKIHSWGRSLFQVPKVKLLLSYHINCLNDFCIKNADARPVQPHKIRRNEKIKLCTSNSCFEKSENLSKIIDAFSNSGFNYLYNFRFDNNP